VFANDVCGFPVCNGRYLCVEVKGEARIGVSQAILGRLDVDATGNKCGRGGPSKIVESSSAKSSTGARGKPNSSAPVCVLQWTSVGSNEDVFEAIGRGHTSPTEMLGEELDERLRCAHHSQ